MKLKFKKYYIWPSAFVFLVIVSVFLFNDERVNAELIVLNMSNKKTNVESTTNTNSAEIASNETANPNTAVVNANTNTDNLPAGGQGLQLTTYNYSFPILMYHHIRDFNNPTDQIGTNLSVSPAEFAKQLDLIKEKGYTTITFRDISAGNVPDKAVILTFDDGYANFYQNAYPELLRRGMKAVSYVIVNDIGKGDYLTDSQIVELSNSGVEIGSHTLSHPDLATATEAKSRREVFDSKSSLEKIIGKKIISLCYPSGKFTATTETLTKEAGYEFAVTTNSGITTFKDYFALNRYRVNNGTSIANWIK